MVRMNDEETNIFLARPYLAAFSTVDRKGKPHVTSVWYLYTEGDFFHVIEKRSVKWRNLTRGSSIGICVHNNDDERTLSAYGNPRFLEPTDEEGWNKVKYGAKVISESSFLLSLPCLLYTSPSPRDGLLSRMPSSA